MLITVIVFTIVEKDVVKLPIWMSEDGSVLLKEEVWICEGT